VSTRRPQSASGKILINVMRNIELLAEELKKEGLRVATAYLFGSYARGDWIQTSDIDLVIVSPDFEGMKYTQRLDIIYKIAWRLRLTPWIEAIPLTPSELKDKLRHSVVLRDASKYWVEIPVNS